MKKNILILLCLFTNLIAYAAPGNDACGSATALPCATVNLAGTTVNCVSEGTFPTGYASPYGVWYTFTGDGNSTTISTTAGAGFDHELVIMTGAACAGFVLVSDQDVGLSGGTETYTFTSTLGTTYYVYIAYYSTSGSTANEGTFTISRSCVASPTPPGNDACGSATALPCATVNLTGTTVDCVSEGTFPTGYASPYGVWYTFVGDGNSTTISTTAGAGFDHEMVIMTGVACGGFALVTDQDAGFSGGTETYTFTSTLGTTYYVYIAYYSTSGTASSEGSFTISRSCIISCTATITLATNGTIGAANICAGTTNVNLQNFSLAVTGGCSGNLTDLSFTTVGAYAAADISNFKF